MLKEQELHQLQEIRYKFGKFAADPYPLAGLSGIVGAWFCSSLPDQENMEPGLADRLP